MKFDNVDEQTDQTGLDQPVTDQKAINPVKKRKKGLIITLIVILLVIAGGVAAYLLMGRDNSQAETENQKTSQASGDNEPKEAKVLFAALGDMLAHDTVIQNAKTADGYNFSKYFSGIRDSYKDAEVVFCNQEGSSAGEDYGISGYPAFNAPKEFSRDLSTGAGCNVINLANNHIADKGQGAIDVTLNVWQDLKPLAVAGANRSAAEQQRASYFSVNGIKFAFLAFADFSNNKAVSSYGLNNYHDTNLVKSLVNQAKASAEMVVVSMHWGVEDSTEVSADQYAAAQLLNTLGVDVIIGTGPHVLQKVDWLTNDDGYKTLVWYSIGNMLSSQLLINELTGGIATFEVVKSADGKEISVEQPKFIPTYMHYEWTPSQAAAEDLLARTNLNLYLLSEAQQPLERSLHDTTVSERYDFVKSTLGSDVTVVE